MKSILVSTLVGAVAFGFLAGRPASAATYHVSPIGSDANNGLSPEKAWLSIAKVNAKQFVPGDQVLFQRGGVWRENLKPSCDGTKEVPIVFAAYGKGGKPIFCGSDPLPEAKEWKRNGVLWSCPIPAKVTCVIEGKKFWRSAVLIAKEKSAESARESLRATQSSWRWENGILEVNSGQEPPPVLSAVTRENMVLIDRRKHLVLRDLAVTDTACYNSGYGFAVFFSTGITLEDCDARRCGKHHFGLINSTEILLNRCYSAEVMPDQGVGGASAYVSFSDKSRKGDTSRYVDCVTENYLDEPAKSYYPAFLSHGEGIGTIEIKGMISRGSPIIVSNDKESGARTRIRGGLIEDASLHLYGNGIVADGVKIRRGTLEFLGTGDIAENMVIEDYNGGFQGHQCAVVVHGTGNVLRSSTVRVSPKAPAFNAPLCLLGKEPDFHWKDNVLGGPGLAVRISQGGADLSKCRASGNTYSKGAEFQVDSKGRKESLADWQLRGFDKDAKLAR